METTSLRDTLTELASQAGVQLNGPNPWDIQVKDDRVYTRVLRERNLGLGESYMDGWWECEQLDEMVFRISTSGLADKIRGNIVYLLRLLPAVIFNLQSTSRARLIAEHHYDMGNDLFMSFLDPYNQYSCGYFEGTDDLDQAQLNKLALICGKLHLCPSDEVLDVGCGWGGFAKYAAERHGCTVTAVNISKEQLQYARDFCAGLPVHLLDCDYRNITGHYDKIVSVGMFEHVGCKNYSTFMRVVHDRLKDDGICLLHTIGSNTTAKTCDPWMTKYIFPNGMLPSMAQIARTAENLFVIEDWHNIGPHYDKTLMAWNERFQKAWPRLKDTYPPRFKRMWEYFLLTCAGAFRARRIQVWQIVMTKAGSGQPQPVCRNTVSFPAVDNC